MTRAETIGEIDELEARIDKRDCLRRLETEWLPSEVLKELP